MFSFCAVDHGDAVLKGGSGKQAIHDKIPKISQSHCLKNRRIDHLVSAGNGRVLHSYAFLSENITFQNKGLFSPGVIRFLPCQI
ncbi:hypothetical protein EPIR_3361 [Erwinia piriflorinigrans CFBP 5888]|uniref:Uncharacterized protein n=1 Tax=Erwinia piriflorinigrans CFBP 5888 TaxID=1161919 RepID=V5ZCP3_9GAMM|nr:hypothetical protein EPIR_3361 [Erwinia piriflorinigrans CFBP 5888]